MPRTGAAPAFGVGEAGGYREAIESGGAPAVGGHDRALDEMKCAVAHGEYAGAALLFEPP
nr:hypothetical protein [Nocardia tengchongensis]